MVGAAGALVAVGAAGCGAVVGAAAAGACVAGTAGTAVAAGAGGFVAVGTGVAVGVAPHAEAITAPVVIVANARNCRRDTRLVGADMICFLLEGKTILANRYSLIHANTERLQGPLGFPYPHLLAGKSIARPLSGSWICYSMCSYVSTDHSLTQLRPAIRSMLTLSSFELRDGIQAGTHRGVGLTLNDDIEHCRLAGFDAAVEGRLESPPAWLPAHHSRRTTRTA